MNIKAKKLTTKIALTACIAMLVVWSVLGAGTSLAWFKDETPVNMNIFNFPDFDVNVKYKTSDMADYEDMRSDVNVFGDGVAFEPGYTRVVYLKIINNGDVDLKYRLAVCAVDAKKGTSVLGNEIYLPNYLRYGVVFGDSEAELNRELAQSVADGSLSELATNSFSRWDTELIEGDRNLSRARYAALVVYMPKEVGNEANYRGNDAPDVTLGIAVYAEQFDKTASN